MTDQLKPRWNDLYGRVPYSRLKVIYKPDYALSVRTLNPKCVNIANFDQHIRELMLNSATNDKCQKVFTMKYLIEDLNGMMSSSPDAFYQQINASFENERNMYSQGTLTLTQIDADILWLLLQNRCNQTAVKRYKTFYESYKSHNWTQLGNCIQTLSMEIVGSIHNAVKLMNIVLQKIHSHRDHLSQLKREQMWSDACREHFAQIQVWFDEIATIIYDTLDVIQTMQQYDKLCCVDEMKQFCDTLDRLIKSILVVEVEPTEILKTETYSPCTIRVLLTLNNFKFNITDLNVSILSKDRKNSGKVLLQNNFKKGQQKTPDFEKDQHDLYCHLKTLKVDKVKRNKSLHGYVENKYFLTFDLKIQADKKEIKVSTDSWPLFVIVHHTQEALARAAHMWDKHLTGVARSSEASVPWYEMCTVLRFFFKNVTGFELNDGHLAALHDKATREDIITDDNFHWEASCNSMKNVKFMFWEWYFGAMKFIKDHIKGLWGKGLVEGFASTKFLKNNFPNYPVGCFLLRFSESTIGALILMWVDRKGEVIQASLSSSDTFMMKNRSPNDSKETVIVNMIRDIKQCTHLFNGTPKDEAFLTESTNDKNFTKYERIKTTYAVDINNSTSSAENTAIAVPNSPDLNSPMQSNNSGSPVQSISGSSNITGFNSLDSNMHGPFTNKSLVLDELPNNDNTTMMWDISLPNTFDLSNTEMNDYLFENIEDYPMTTPIQVNVINSLHSSVGTK